MDESETSHIIAEFANYHNYAIPYVRSWETTKQEKMYDVGSHTEFFVWTSVPLEDVITLDAYKTERNIFQRKELEKSKEPKPTGAKHRECFLCGSRLNLQRVPYSNSHICLNCEMEYRLDGKETHKKNQIVCPHCGNEEIPSNFKENYKREMRCPKCKKRFDVFVENVYTTRKSLCEIVGEAPKNKKSPTDSSVRERGGLFVF